MPLLSWTFPPATVFLRFLWTFPFIKSILPSALGWVSEIGIATSTELKQLLSAVNPSVSMVGFGAS